MHQSRRTHNVHYETQKRLANASRYRVTSNKAPRLRPIYEWTHYVENRRSRKWLKKMTNKSFRKSKMANEFNIVNGKVISRVYDRLIWVD